MFRFIWAIILGGAVATSVNAQAQTQLTVMSFNAWGGGANNGKTTEQTVAAIRASGADVIGMQETRAESVPCTAIYCFARGKSIAAELARSLGFYYYEQTLNALTQSTDVLWANAILSRYPISDPSPNNLGIRIDVAGKRVYLFNIHPTDYPYTPYQILGIPYGAEPPVQTSAAAVRYARRARVGALNLLLRDMAAVGEADLMLVTGDFNEPSHRDWTPATVAAGLQPMAVPWPFTQALEANGFVDAYRSIFPDPVSRPGFTWSPLIAGDTSDDHRDRIDFIFVRGSGVRIEEAAVVGESSDAADIVVQPWPSDHRAVVARLEWDDS